MTQVSCVEKACVISSFLLLIFLSFIRCLFLCPQLPSSSSSSSDVSSLASRCLLSWYSFSLTALLFFLILRDQNGICQNGHLTLKEYPRKSRPQEHQAASSRNIFFDSNSREGIIKSNKTSSKATFSTGRFCGQMMVRVVFAFFFFFYPNNNITPLCVSWRMKCLFIRQQLQRMTLLSCVRLSDTREKSTCNSSLLLWTVYLQVTKTPEIREEEEQREGEGEEKQEQETMQALSQD